MSGGDINETITTREAARMLGVTDIRIRQLIREGRLRHIRDGTRYLVFLKEIQKCVLDGLPEPPPKTEDKNNPMVWVYRCVRR